MAAVTHHIPPEPGVTEIRVHGVGGTTPSALLDQTGVRQVSGDAKAGMFRGAVSREGRTVEAYSWGGLTSRSKSRAFWVLLLPFSFVNLAGWMVEPKRTYAADDETSFTTDSWTRSRGTKWHESMVQLIGIATTAMYVMWVAMIAMNAVAFQCGGIAACREDRWYMEPFNTGFFLSHPGRRIVAAMIVPLGLLAFFWVLGSISRSRYDDFGSQSHEQISQSAGQASRSVISEPEFWYTSQWQENLARIHVSVVVLILAGLLGRAAIEFEDHFGVDFEAVPNIPSWIPLVPTGLLAGAAVVVVFYATWSSRDVLGSGTSWLDRPTRILLALSIVLLAVSAYFAWHLDVADAELLEQLEELVVAETPVDAEQPTVPSPNTDLWGFGWAPILLLGLSALFVAAFSVVQIWRWIQWKLALLDQFVVPLMFFFIVLWEWAAWIAAIAFVTGIGVHVFLGFAKRSRDEERNGWRLGVYLTVCVVAGAVALVSADWGSPYGQGWPRATPMIAFTAVLVVLNLLQSQGMFNVREHEGGIGVRFALSAIPGAIIVVGFLLYEVVDRVEWISGMALLAFTVMAVVWLAQYRFDGWRWNGPAAAAVFGLSIVMGAFSGVVIWLVDILDRDGDVFALRATGIYEWLAVAFAAMLVAIAAGFGVWVIMVRFGISRPSGSEPARKGETLPEAVKAIDVVFTVAVLLLISGVVALVAHLGRRYGFSFAEWIDDGAPEDWRGIVQAASWISLGVGVGVFFAVRNGLKDASFRTRFGALWDIASFWPRSFHPFAPPAYAARAVPEIQARLTEVATRAAAQPDWMGHGSESGAVILSGHSQGAVISVAAIASIHPDVIPRLRLVTYGSPLDRFYHLYFPRYFPRSLFDYCARSLGPTDDVADAGWLNFWRKTDPIGAPVYGARDRTPPEGQPSVEVSVTLARCVTSTEQLPDVLLDDPMAREFAFQLDPGVRGHSGYMADPGMWLTLDAIASDLRGQLDAIE